MLEEMLYGYTSDRLLGKMLDKAAVAQRVISSNIAHVGTPGYNRLGVSFEQALQKAVRKGNMPLERTDPRHLPDMDYVSKLNPKVVEIEDGYWNGINNVNIDQEMTDLAKNQLDFDMASRLLAGKFTSLKTAIRGKR